MIVLYELYSEEEGYSLSAKINDADIKAACQLGKSLIAEHPSISSVDIDIPALVVDTFEDEEEPTYFNMLFNRIMVSKDKYYFHCFTNECSGGVGDYELFSAVKSHEA